MERHHFRSRAFQRVHIFLNRNEFYTEGRIEHFQVSTSFNMVSAEAGEILHDYGADLSVFDHGFHALKAGTLKCCSADAIINKIHWMQMTVLLGVIHEYDFLVCDRVGLSLDAVILAETTI